MYLKAKSRGMTFVEDLLKPRTKEVCHLMMKEKNFAGASDFKTLGLIYSMILFTRSTKVLELGTLLGYSGLYFLDAISKSTRRKEKILVTVDQSKKHQDKAKEFFNKAGFQKIAKLVPYNSLTIEAKKAVAKFAPYDIMYIDSAHNYQTANKELNIYFKMLKKGGIIFCHDASKLAARYDKNKEGGVRRALNEFIDKNPIQSIFLQKTGTGWNTVGLFMGIKTN